MSITKILKSDATPEYKVKAVATAVKKVRESYGNLKADIAMPEVNTVSGILPLSALSDESKVHYATVEVGKILQAVVEQSKAIEGVNTAKAAEALIATNPVLVNIAEEVSCGQL